MELNEYQEKAMSTCMDTCNNFSYMMLNLVGEVGEFASKVAKNIRKDEMCIGWADTNAICYCDGTEENQPYIDRTDDALKKEAGDILWQLAGLCKVMGWSLEDIAKLNLTKLQARKKAGTIDGNGDGVTKEERQ